MCLVLGKQIVSWRSFCLEPAPSDTNIIFIYCRENVRRKRQADAGVGTAAYYKQIYDEMMRLLGEMFRSGQLSNQQVATATNIINLTQVSSFV